MKNDTLARPYAKAAYLYAKEQGTVELWFQFLGKLGLVFADHTMQNLLQNPQLPKETLLAIITENMSPSPDQGMQNFLKELTHQQRLAVLPEMVELFAEDWQMDRHVKEFTVSSATALSTAQITELEQNLTAQFKQPVFLTLKIDESLMGGMMIQSGDYVVDGSLKGQLNRLKYSLRK
ncbi:MAG: F0F1 ATP synthase subunit delta [Gammaproteobacteria bacterium]|jgi:F-type H+-transporting ATPase subunit delta|nr:F0F1 ATP synthase subunit delta [Gammaproteobacteria bacterium]